MNLSPIHYHDTETAQSANLGVPYRQDSTGRAWRYAENGGTQADPGKLMVAATVTAEHVDLAPAVTAAGANKVTVTLGAAAAAANLYKDGFLVVQDNAGEGIAYPLSDHDLVGSGGTGVFTLAAGEKVQVALTASTDVDLIKSLYKDVVISVTDQADPVVGVFNVTVAADAYAMVQTWGPAAVWQDEATGVGDMLVTGTGTAGQVETDDAAGEPLVGMQGPTAGADGDYQLVYLKIEP